MSLYPRREWEWQSSTIQKRHSSKSHSQWHSHAKTVFSFAANGSLKHGTQGTESFILTYRVGLDQIEIPKQIAHVYFSSAETHYKSDMVKQTKFDISVGASEWSEWIITTMSYGQKNEKLGGL